MRLLLSADWQIGARFGRFGTRGELLQRARVRTLERVLTMAADRKVDAMVVAGDLFEDHQIPQAEVVEVYKLLARHSAVPILVVPGNHDAAAGAGTIWARQPFVQPPEHVKVFTTAAALEVAEGWVLVSPLAQKHSTTDPSLKLDELAQGVPVGRIKVGITHGSPAIEGMHQKDDFPVAIDAATRGGLDFLGLGHWHSSLLLDGGRMLMAGTPEPTSFEEKGSGFVHEIEIARAGDLPRVTALPCAELRWCTVSCEVTEARERAEGLLAELDRDAARTVVRVTLEGLAAPEKAKEMMAWLRARTDGFAVNDCRDATTADFGAEELAALQREHPLLTGVIDDLKALESGGSEWGRGEVEVLANALRCQATELTEPLMAVARGILMRELREVQRGC